MNIREEYIIKTRNYLKALSSRLDSIKMIELEIDELKSKDNSYKDIRFDNLGIKSKGSTKGIDDMIISAKDMIYIKEAEIDFIRKKYKFIKSIIENMEKCDQDIIEYRYFKRNKLNEHYKISEIANEINYSKATVKRRELKIIKHIAYSIYGNSSLKEEYESEPIMSHTLAV